MEPNTDIEFLISAFAYSSVSMNETFYLRKADLKVIGVHIFDHTLISECQSEYESGLTKDEERDIKEAIIANEKNYDTHLFIPRLSKEERFEMMSKFIELNDTYKSELHENLKALIDSTENYGIEFYKKGIKPGVEMEYLTNGIDDEKIKSQWTEFYRSQTKTIAMEWLNQQKRPALEKNTKKTFVQPDDVASYKVVSRYYKISVNFGLFYYYYNSKTFRLRKGISPYLVGFLYTLLNLFTGFWGFLGILRKFKGLRNTFKAIYINLSGGEDITKLDIESNYDKYTVYIYNNLDRASWNEMSLSDVEIILDIQEIYLETNTELFTAANIHFILDNLSKVDLERLTEKHIESVFYAIGIHDKYNS